MKNNVVIDERGNLTEYNDDGTVSYIKRITGTEEFFDYDDNGKLQHSWKETNSFVQFHKYYDENGEITQKLTINADGSVREKYIVDKANGTSYFYEKYPGGTTIEHRNETIHNNDGTITATHTKTEISGHGTYENKSWTTYTSKEMLERYNFSHYKEIRMKDGKVTGESEIWKTYNEDNQTEMAIYSDGSIDISDKNGNTLYFKDKTGMETWYEFNEFGCIHEKCSNGHESFYEYDTNGNMIHAKFNYKPDEWYRKDYLGDIWATNDKSIVPDDIVELFGNGDCPEWEHDESDTKWFLLYE